MKRTILAAAVVLLASLWPKPAHAQLGLLNLNIGTPASSTKITGTLPSTQQSTLKKKQATAPAPPPLAGPSRTHAAHVTQAPIGAGDRSGRHDLAGHQIGGYAAIRGELYGPGAIHPSRGGANGKGGMVIRRR